MSGNGCEMWDRSTGTRATDSRAQYLAEVPMDVGLSFYMRWRGC